MTFSGIPGFNFDDLTAIDNNNCYGGDSDLSIDYLDPSNFTGPSQLYTGVDILGGLDDYPDFPSASAAPTSLYPANGAFLSEEYNSILNQGRSVPSFSSKPASTPFPFLPYPSHGLPSLPLGPYAAPIAPSHSYAQPRVIPSPYDPSFGFTTAEDNFSLSVDLPPQAHNPPYEQTWHQQQCPRLDAFDSDISPLAGITGATLHEIPPQPPVASSSGPQRTRQSARKVRRYDPFKPTKKPMLKRNGWDQTLARFRAKLETKFDTLKNACDGQPSGWLVPETTLAKIDKIMKEDLKRSPLRDFTAGEGKRSRNMEKYLEGLLQAIRPPEPTSTSGSAGSDENGTTVATLSRLADELEAGAPSIAQRARNWDENERQAVREAGEEEQDGEGEEGQGAAPAGEDDPPVQGVTEGLVKKGLAVLFLLYGPTAFPRGFIEIRPDSQSL